MTDYERFQRERDNIKSQSCEAQAKVVFEKFEKNKLNKIMGGFGPKEVISQHDKNIADINISASNKLKALSESYIPKRTAESHFTSNHKNNDNDNDRGR